jgi:hypothetical protein
MHWFCHFLMEISYLRVYTLHCFLSNLYFISCLIQVWFILLCSLFIFSYWNNVLGINRRSRYWCLRHLLNLSWCYKSNWLRLLNYLSLNNLRLRDYLNWWNFSNFLLLNQRSHLWFYDLFYLWNNYFINLFNRCFIFELNRFLYRSKFFNFNSFLTNNYFWL